MSPYYTLPVLYERNRVSADSSSVDEKEAAGRLSVLRGLVLQELAWEIGNKEADSTHVFTIHDARVSALHLM